MINAILKLRDENNQVVKEIQEFENFSCELKLNDVGTWTLNGSEFIPWLQGVQLFFDGTCVFSGVAKKFKNIWDTTGEVFQSTGVCENSLLERRIVLPVPNGPPYTVDYDVLTGPAESVLKYFVDANLGVSAKANRQYPGLRVGTDQGRGNQITGHGRFQSLLKLCQDGATQGNIWFQVLNLLFEVFVPQDKTASVILSKELGTLAKYDLTINSPKSNYIFAGGSGTGSSRLIMENLLPESVNQFGVYEKFLNQQSISNGVEMQSIIAGELETDSASYSLEVVPLDTEYTQVYRDYWLGDKVKVILNNGSIIEDVIGSVRIVLDSGGLTITPVLGLNKQQNFLSSIAERIIDMDQRISAVERL